MLPSNTTFDQLAALDWSGGEGATLRTLTNSGGHLAEPVVRRLRALFHPSHVVQDALHVLGTDDGLEHLRFDCFEQEPHYHYIDQGAVTNTVVRIDELAVGDPIEFSLACVEEHLPDMLSNCGVPALADEVKGRIGEVLAAMAEVRALMLRAQEPVG